MEILLKNLQKKIPVPKAKIIRIAIDVLKRVKSRDGYHFFKKSGSRPYFSIAFVGARRMHSINKKFLGHDYVTDVLTFDLGGGQAEIVICPEVAAANGRIYKTSTEKELILYVVHGILHLAGFDDHEPQDILRMRRMENELLK